MLSYQHAYHAGNHADILKHFVLCYVLENLNKKEKPYTFFDTHSGSGLYDLLDDRTLKTNEAKKGIEKLFENRQLSDFPQEMQTYCKIVSSYLKENLYPGSPEIERSLIRNDDFLILSELHPQEIENLKKNISSQQKKTGQSKQVQIHHRSGWEMLKALTPPKTKRGAVLIDPSYEETADYLNAAKVINEVHKKWSNGIIMLWYPLLAHREIEINAMIDDISASCKIINQNVEICRLELCVNDKDSHKEVSLQNIDKNNPPRLYGSGMLVINAPWKLEESALSVIDFVKTVI